MGKPRLRSLNEQVIVITGASSGIGLVTARMAAARGAKVLLVARSEDALADAVRAIRAVGGVADYAVADVRSREAVRAAAAKAVDRFGRIDTWVNNAGVAIFARLVDTPDDEHRAMMDTNYFGTVNGSLAAIDHLRAAGGAIVTLGSIGSDMPTPILSAYSATKFAIRAYTDALRTELGDAGLPIAVTLIKPSGVATPITERAASHIGGGPRVPPPVYDPAVVARAILDAAENVRRDVTVGGLGRAAVLAGTHFPWLLDATGRIVEAVMADRGRSPNGAGAVLSPMAAGRERSASQTGRGFSLYTGALRHPASVRIAMLGAALTIGALAMRGRRRQTY